MTCVVAFRQLSGLTEPNASVTTVMHDAARSRRQVEAAATLENEDRGRVMCNAAVATTQRVRFRRCRGERFVSIASAMNYTIQATIADVLTHAPEWIRHDLVSKEPAARKRAEGTLAAMIASALANTTNM